MTQQHPITPQPELVQQWVDTYFGGRISQSNFHVDLATQAAQWGADQELEACCKWFQEFYETETWVDLDLRTFRATRRPKPPSLKDRLTVALQNEDIGTALRLVEQLDD
jgi:hypothetical protein